VLTRLPSGLAVRPGDAATVLIRRFHAEPLGVPSDERSALLQTLAAAGVSGGATYDGLVGVEAKAHRRTLLTLDERAQSTYQRLGVAFEAIV
jgi:toxin FitB